MEISNLVAVVTGGASGLGGATARLLAERGAKVAIFDLNEDEGRQLAAQIDADFYRVDVSQEASVDSALDEMAQAVGSPRILVNCAGIAPAAKTIARDYAPHSIDVFRRAVEINLIGTFIMVSRVAARMARLDPIGEERGVVVNTASIAAMDGQIGQAAYASSKGGVVSLTLPVARDLAQHQVRIMTIAPGIFWTPMLAGLPEAAQESLGKSVPHPSRLGRPEEFALMVESIIRNPMLNGEVIRLDGAMRMPPK